MKKLLRILGNCIVVFVIVACLPIAVPRFMGMQEYNVISGSMEPEITIGSVVYVREAAFEDLNVGDIIAFENEGVVITHRILLIDGNTITVKGDKNNTIDKPIDRSQVIGKVIKIIPKFGIWKKIITEPKILFVIFITLVLFDFALSYNKEDKLIEKELDRAFNSDPKEKKKIVKKKKTPK